MCAFRVGFPDEPGPRPIEHKQLTHKTPLAGSLLVACHHAHSMSYPEAGPSSGLANPLKLKFKLGGASSTPGSPLQPSSPAPSEPDFSYAASIKSENEYPTSTVDESENGGSVPPVGLGLAPPGAGAGQRLPSLAGGQDKPKRKRAPKKGPNEPVQPGGKGWRKGVKGSVARRAHARPLYELDLMSAQAVTSTSS